MANKGSTPQTNFKSIQHPGNEIHMVGNPSYEHGGISKIQCNYGKEGEGAKKTPHPLAQRGENMN